MSEFVSRRAFLGQSTAALAAAGVAGAGILSPAGAESLSRTPAGKLKKALLWSMLPDKISIADRFKLTADLGFDGIEAMTVEDQKVEEEMRAAADKTGIPIHSVMNMGHWQNPLSSDKPEAVAKGVQAMKVSLRNAKAFGADTVLLVPAVVNPATRYQDAYTRSQKVIREEVLPAYREAGVAIGVENVWNKFLLSPLEFARYIDEFQDPHVQAYFDIGNIVQYGYPEDWILTLGPRIKKLHLKDFKRSSNRFVALREGDVNWPVVRKAIDQIGYGGFLTAELAGGDEAYLREVAKRIDLILEGK
jgi:L-ribulose-5-phosphate 3-epimerase